MNRMEKLRKICISEDRRIVDCSDVCFNESLFRCSKKYIAIGYESRKIDDEEILIVWVFPVDLPKRGRKRSGE